ncbi:MAG: phosphoglycerol transferase [Gammaproteobacteria bacterium]|nr:MAG: phosphoglycerol transferase [Gammaproteobacteria bacterium]
MLLKLPKILRLLIIFIPSLVIFYTFLRFVFLLFFVDDLSSVSFYDTMQAIFLGARFDIRIITLMILPLFLLGGIKFLNPFNYKILHYFWLSYLSIFFVVILLFYVTDFGHYAYLHNRLNFSVIRFLADPIISAQMLWQSYPVVFISLGFISVSALFIFLTHKLFIIIYHQSNHKIGFLKNLIIAFISFSVVLFLIHSRFSQYPLRWSDAVFSKSTFLTELTYNPVHYFFDTWKNGGAKFDKKKVEKYYPIMTDYLGVKNKDIKNLNFKRVIKPNHLIGKKPNIIIIVLESFASYKSSVSDNPLDPSPDIGKLAKDGFYFENFYTPATGTARSIYALLTGLPDVELNGTSSRNPLIVGQHSIASDFKNYHKSYFIGGSASWGNIRGMLNSSLDDLKLYEEGFYKAPRTDVWGVSDIDLLTEAHNKITTQQQPFFSIIQTSGNHRPYTIPANNYGFNNRDDLSDKQVKKYGFESVKEYNSFRFMDYSVGHFMSLAKKSDYYKNTIFVFFGDHGITGNVGTHIKNQQAQTELELGSLNVPFIIYSPLIQNPQTFTKIVSEVDVLPTLASLVNISYTATTIGRDMFDEKYDDNRYAFSIHHSSNPTIGLIGQKYYYKTQADGTNAGLYGIYSKTPLNNISEQNIAITKKMKNLTFGIYESSKYIPYHNSKNSPKTGQ